MEEDGKDGREETVTVSALREQVEALTIDYRLEEKRRIQLECTVSDLQVTQRALLDRLKTLEFDIAHTRLINRGIQESFAKVRERNYELEESDTILRSIVDVLHVSTGAEALALIAESKVIQ